MTLLPEILDGSPVDIKNQMAVVLEEAGFKSDDIYDGLGINLVQLRHYKAINREVLDPFISKAKSYIACLVVSKLAKIVGGLDEAKILKLSPRTQVDIAKALAEVGVKMEEKAASVEVYSALVMKFSKKEG